MSNLNKHAISNLQDALATYRERNKTYGNNYKRFGHIMKALFPDGLHLQSVDDFNRYGVIFMRIAKLSRYVTNPMVGHLDSVHDDIVYAAMLEELDSEITGAFSVEPPEDLITTIKKGAHKPLVQYSEFENPDTAAEPPIGSSTLVHEVPTMPCDCAPELPYKYKPIGVK